MVMNLRAFLFWTLDALKGGIVRKYCKEVSYYLRNDCGENVNQLKHILDWSVNNVEFYKKYKGYKSILDFPVINKSIIKGNMEKLLCPKYDKSKLFKEETSGSTGTPLVIYQDDIKRKRARADTIVFSDFAGYKFGTKLYYSRVWNNFNRKSSLQSKIQNIVMQDSDKLSDSELESFIQKLEKDQSEKSVLIFASTLAALFRYLETRKRKTTAIVASFITMSESLADNVREGIQKIYKTNVVARYSDCECGILAQQCPNHSEFHINRGSFYIELLKFDSDEKAEEGEMGRIVVTDLYNHAMPIIRYDTGDVGVISYESKCKTKGKVFTRVDGRRIDCIYSTKGEMLSPYIVNNTLWRFEELKQYQFIQNDVNDYIVKLNVKQQTFNREKELLDALKHYIGEDANIKVEYVEEIPLLASGKRKQVINNYKK